MGADEVVAGESGAGGGPEDWVERSGDRQLRAHGVLEATVDWSSQFERDELAARAHRMRKIIAWGALAWLAFLATDVSFNVLRGDDHGLRFMVTRVLALVPLVVAWLHLGRSARPSRASLVAHEVLCMATIAGVTAYQALLSGGFSSPMLAAVPPMLVVRALGIPEPWGTAAAVPIGWPLRRGHGPISRRPPEKLAFADAWGETWPGAD